ncbi:polyketide cyclase [Streptomyces sp. WM6372]|uniref:SRPBCC family protein n=1 Tax=Streptomyces sp. WM6372 TaxID=1415555 RepID=UPI0006AE1C75|nr:SRPBCC family protein [Streptomyces sp. WM6372]KOU13782.1 polyketide cyclase [Streptomyces sp. WM6372]
MSDIVGQINDIHREVGRREVGGEEARTVLLRRTYPAAAEDVWDACTSPERLGRWFLPVSGDLRPGGRYQLEGNAGGEILRCEPPRLLRVSWVMGQAPGFSEVEVRLTPEGAERTVFELEHVAVVEPKFWDQYGPGAVGVGWDLTVLGLGMHLEGRSVHPSEAVAWMASDGARAFMTGSSEAWGEAHTASGESAAAVAASVHATTEFYVPPKAE